MLHLPFSANIFPAFAVFLGFFKRQRQNTDMNGVNVLWKTARNNRRQIRHASGADRKQAAPAA
jgi:hypothetical protein